MTLTPHLQAQLVLSTVEKRKSLNEQSHATRDRYVVYVCMCVGISDVNDAELFNAEPRILVIDAEPILSFSEKKRPQAEPRL